MRQLFNNLEDVKNFLIWAKTERIQALEIDGVKCEFSALAFIDAEPPTAQPPIAAESAPSDLKDDEEALYWSAR